LSPHASAQETEIAAIDAGNMFQTWRRAPRAWSSRNPMIGSVAYRMAINVRAPRNFWLLAVIGLSSASSCARRSSNDEAPVTVAAAADLAMAFREIGEAYANAGHPKPSFTFGSTGLLAQQVSEGAPYDVFAAANVSFVDDVVKSGACASASKTLYAQGRIAIVARKGATEAPPQTLADLASPRFARIAIANPEHAPYGRAAEEALTHDGVWALVKSKLVYGENVQQAMLFAQTGNADVAIVALSLATLSDGFVSVIAADKHKPIDQALVVCGKEPRAAAGRAFVAFVASPVGRATMKRFGFVLPGELTAGQAR
jgi:molybdate transport system substrate-binding protein